jgi:glycosyltransferase involved in cell wall biosynthesis
MHSPPQESIRDIYAGCDAWLFGSRSEGFGLPVLEAMACRTPVIATPTGAGPEAVKSGDNGFLVNHEDPAGMADAIVRICEMDDGTWRQVSESAYRTAAGYDWGPSTEMFERALQSAAFPRRGGEVSELASA